MIFYDYWRSSSAWRVRIALHLKGIPFERRVVNLIKDGGEQHASEFRALNPRGQVPAMEIEGRVFWDSTAHLVYIARRYGGEQWLPTEALAMAEVMQWMAFAQNEIHFGLQWARGILVYGRPGDLQEYQGYGRKGLALLESHLANHEWLAVGPPTIADIACYPYVKRAPQAGVTLDDYPAVAAWLARCEALPGWLKLD